MNELLNSKQFRTISKLIYLHKEKLLRFKFKCVAMDCRCNLTCLKRSHYFGFDRSKCRKRLIKSSRNTSHTQKKTTTVQL